MDETPQLGFVYRHYKGNTYKVLHVAQDVNHSEMQWVIYQSDADPQGKVWARGLKEFTEILGSPGSHFHRFERVF